MEQAARRQIEEISEFMDLGEDELHVRREVKKFHPMSLPRTDYRRHPDHIPGTSLHKKHKFSPSPLQARSVAGFYSRQL